MESVCIDVIRRTENENLLYYHFIDITSIKSLLYLYKISESENTRNGKLIPSVGSAKEKDLIANLIYSKKFKIKHNIPDNKSYDVVVNDTQISIKHITNKKVTEQGVKIVWTVDRESCKKFIDTYIPDVDMLLIYNHINNISIIYIDRNVIFRYYHLWQIEKRTIFKTQAGNTRGIEFSNVFFHTLVKNATFHIKISNIEYDNKLICPIDNRIYILSKICCLPENNNKIL